MTTRTPDAQGALPTLASGTRVRMRCMACSQAVRGPKRWLCADCSDLRERLFRESHSPADADWIAARNQWFGTMAGVEAVRDALDAEAERRVGSVA